MTPIEYSSTVRQSEMTKARMIVFFLSALFTIVISLSAPGNADRSIFPRVFEVCFSRPVCECNAKAELYPICTIWLDIWIVLSRFVPSVASWLMACWLRRF